MNTPTLRFKGFLESYKQIKLGDIVQGISSGRTSTKSLAGNYNLYGSTGLIGYTDQGDYQGEKILIARVGANAGTLYKASGVYGVTDNTLIVDLRDDTNCNYLYYYLAKANLNKLVYGSGQPLITSGLLKVLPLHSPNIKEQQKIADFLTSVDEKINLLNKKKELLEQYKKGVMQKIFSQELRFKDDEGNDFPEWEEKELGDLIEEVVDKTKFSNQHRILSSTAKGLFNQDEYFTRDIASKDNSGYKILRKDQLVFSPQNLWLGNINVNTTFEVGIVSPSYKIFSFINNHTTASFCKYFLLTPNMMFHYEQCSEQGASVVRRNLDMSLFLKIYIQIPSLPEQQKIADFLTGLDDKITLVEQQINKTELWKKGLLQQMFV